MVSTKQKVIIGVGILAFAVGVYFLTKKNQNGTSILGGKPKKFIDEGDANVVPSFSASQKSALLYEAMNRYTGTDETLIFEALTDVTQAQFGLINKSFGYKNYNSLVGYNTIGGSQAPLKTWLKEELNDADYSLLRKKFPLYL